MTIANLASEMGAKNAVFPADEVLEEHLGEKYDGVWADMDARYAEEYNINLSEIYPLTAAPHHVDNVMAIAEVAGKKIDQGLIGTCTNGRLEDMRIAAEILDGKQVAPGFQLLVVPASKEIYLTGFRRRSNYQTDKSRCQCIKFFLWAMPRHRPGNSCRWFLCYFHCKQKFPRAYGK